MKVGPDDRTRLPRQSVDTSQSVMEIHSLRNMEPQVGESVRRSCQSTRIYKGSEPKRRFRSQITKQQNSTIQSTLVRKVLRCLTVAVASPLRCGAFVAHKAGVPCPAKSICVEPPSRCDLPRQGQTVALAVAVLLPLACGANAHIGCGSVAVASASALPCGANAHSLDFAVSRVRKLRLRQGLSQEKLAELANLHRNYVGGVERGERNIALLNIVALAHALKIRPGKLLEPLS